MKIIFLPYTSIKKRKVKKNKENNGSNTDNNISFSSLNCLTTA